MSAHAPLMPSAAGRWVRCPGSVAMEARYPEDADSAKAMQGTAAHWAAAELLEDRDIVLGQIAPNGIVLDDEMCEAAQLYARHIYDTVPGSEHWYVEERVAIPYVHADNWGTPDFFAMYGGVLHIVDFKFGHGYVEVFENWQLLDYACGVLDGVNGAADQHIDVVLTIVQPRSYHSDGPVRSWRVTAAEVRPYFNRLQSAAAAAMQPGAPCRISSECKHCNARHACKALQNAAMDACDVAVTAAPVDMPPDAMGLELRTLQRAADMIKARISGLEEVTLSTIRRGGSVPGYRIEHAKGRKRWNAPIEQVITMAKLMEIDIARSLAAITPSQAVKSGLPADLVDMFSIVPQGEAKIVADDGTRARQVFG